MKEKILFILKQFGFVIAVMLIAILIRYFFFKNLGTSIPYLTFYPAVALVALFGTFTSGIIATIFSIIYIYFYIQNGVASNIELLAHLVFIISGLIVSYIGGLKNENILIQQVLKRNLEIKNNEIAEQNKKLTNEIKSREEADKNLKFINEELSKKMLELEKLNSFMSGRELKMVELKKEVEELKTKLINK